MSTLTQASRTGSQGEQRVYEAPPPLRLPRFLLEQLSRPINSLDDVNHLVANIRLADARGLL